MNQTKAESIQYLSRAGYPCAVLLAIGVLDLLSAGHRDSSSSEIQERIVAHREVIHCLEQGDQADFCESLLDGIPGENEEAPLLDSSSPMVVSGLGI